MKLLLDESIPRRLARSFPESFTVIVILAHRNRLPDLQPLVPHVMKVLGETLEKAIYRITP